MLKIGFANVMYTLWDVTEETRIGYENKPYKVTVCRYIKTVCKDPAKLEILHPAVPIDMTLKGHSSFEIVHRYEPEVKAPVADDEFKYGKYRGMKILECTDASYLKWYLDDGNSLGADAPYLKQRISDLTGEVFVDGLGWTDIETARFFNTRNEMVEAGEEFVKTFENNLGWNNDFSFGIYSFIFPGEMVNEVSNYYGTQRYLINPKNGKNMRVKGKDILIQKYHKSDDNKYTYIVDAFRVM